VALGATDFPGAPVVATGELIRFDRAALAARAARRYRASDGRSRQSSN
jgi:hypothetical protein